MRVPRFGCLIEDKKSKSKKGNNSEKKCISNCLPCKFALWIENTYSDFKGNIFSNNRDITKCQSFYTTTTKTTPRL